VPTAGTASTRWRTRGARAASPSAAASPTVRRAGPYDRRVALSWPAGIASRSAGSSASHWPKP